MADFFVRRPIVAMVLSIVTILIGLVALRGLPIAQYPEIVPPVVQVKTTFVGASAIDVEQAVATPLEQQVNGVENMIYMNSTNANDGTLQLNVSFDVGTNLDMANVLTQNRVQQAQPSLPASVKTYGVTVKKALPFPLMVVALSSPNGTWDSSFLSNYVTINLLDPVSRIRGVGQVNLFGSSDYAMRIWLKPDRLATLGITTTEVLSAINQQNTLTPAGQFGGAPSAPGTEYTYAVRTKGRLLDADEFGKIVLRTTSAGAQVLLEDVARIELGNMLYTSIGRLDGKPAAVMAIYQIPGTNALEIVAEIERTVEELAGRYPPDIEHTIALDTTLAVSEGINEIVHTLFEAVALVILVVFVFLQSWRATLIPLLTVPVSLIGAFILFPAFGFSVKTLSLLGLVLAIGIVVDDDDGVVEAVVHHLEHGMSPRDATLKAMQEVSGPVVAIALILCAVFVPVAFMGGITGRLYQQFALTIAFSVAFSAFNALTLSPALAALLLRPGVGQKGPLVPFYRWFNRVFERFTNGYMSVTRLLAANRFVSAMLLAGIIAAVVVLLRAVPGGFIPEEDQGYFLVNVQLPDASSLERTDTVAGRVESILGETSGVGNVTTITGFSLLTQSMASNTAFFFVSLKEWGERTDPSERVFEMMQGLNARFARDIPEAVVFAFGPPAIPGLGTGAGFSMMLQDRGGNSPEYLGEQVQTFVQAARERPEIGRISSVYRSTVPQVFANIDRDKAIKLGVPIEDVNSTLGTLLGSTYVNDFNRFGRVYKVYVQADAAYRARPEDLGFFQVRSADGRMIPLSTLVDTRPTAGPEFTNRFNLFRSAELSGVPANGYTSTQALTALEETARKVLPQDVGYDWANMSYQEKKAAGSGAAVFGLALVFVFLILAAQYESWGLPLSVLLGTPFAVFGAMLGLWLARMGSDGYVNNVFAQIGLVLLIGLAAKNAILIVEFARMKMDDGMGVYDAAMEAARLRFRPILMTAFAFILGVVPLLTATGAGAEARKVMGMTVFSGMLVATILGVLLVPFLFVSVESLLGGKKHEPQAPAGDLPQPERQAGGH
jgi:hydrophobic/amphiphilic exporter-1 (mainly G- bacteria), HAE1 family